MKRLVLSLLLLVSTLGGLTGTTAKLAYGSGHSGSAVLHTALPIIPGDRAVAAAVRRDYRGPQVGMNA